MKAIDKEKRYYLSSDGRLVFTKNAICVSLKEFNNREDITSVYISKTIVSIEAEAFSGCRFLSSVVFENGCECRKIGKNAFEKCVLLSKISLPQKLSFIDEGAFANCARLKKLYLPFCLAVVAEGAFRGCVRLSEVYVPNVKTILDNQALLFCGKLKKIVYGKRMYTAIANFPTPAIVVREKRIGKYSFMKMRMITFMKDGKIEGSDFWGCALLDDKENYRYVGVGADIKDAYNDLLFYVSRKEKAEELLLTLRPDTKINAKDFRILTNSCRFGVMAFCDFFGITQDDRFPMSFIAQKVKEFPMSAANGRFQLIYNGVVAQEKKRLEEEKAKEEKKKQEKEKTALDKALFFAKS